MDGSKLEKFYESWSDKPTAAIDCDIEGAYRKAEAIASIVPTNFLEKAHSFLDFGCGYGALAYRLKLLLPISKAIGIDFSATAIDIARQRFEGDALQFHRLPSMRRDQIIDFLQQTIPGGVDCILLVDLLEHVPDCKALVSDLARFGTFFIIKLPIESTLFDNYVWSKEYPGSAHSNGHLREFDANNVHYFIRGLGLTPVFEKLYLYDTDDSFPPVPPGTSIKGRLVRLLIRSLKIVLSWLLPTKIFLRVVGGGGYLCVASFDEQHILNP